ncbi:hypothetical protein YC2023_119179 [Brassica napus]
MLWRGLKSTAPLCLDNDMSLAYFKSLMKANRVTAGLVLSLSWMIRPLTYYYLTFHLTSTARIRRSTRELDDVTCVKTDQHLATPIGAYSLRSTSEQRLDDRGARAFKWYNKPRNKSSKFSGVPEQYLQNAFSLVMILNLMKDDTLYTFDGGAWCNLQEVIKSEKDHTEHRDTWTYSVNEKHDAP